MYTLKLSLETIEVLKSFVKINSSLLFRPGSFLSTITPKLAGGTVFARAKIAETFESEFAIFQLETFINALSLFENPNIEIDEKWLNIRENNRKLKVVFAETSFIEFPPDSDLDFPKSITSFKLTENDLSFLKRMGEILKLPEISINANGSKITLNALNSKNPTGDIQSIDVADTDRTFNLIFERKNIDPIKANYDVDVFEGFVRLKSITSDPIVIETPPPAAEPSGEDTKKKKVVKKIPEKKEEPKPLDIEYFIRFDQRSEI